MRGRREMWACVLFQVRSPRGLIGNSRARSAWKSEVLFKRTLESSVLNRYLGNSGNALYSRLIINVYCAFMRPFANFTMPIV